MANNQDDWQDVTSQEQDDWQDITEEQTPVESELSVPELAKTLAGTATGYGVGKALNPVLEKGAEKVIDPLAEKLAFTAAGGHDTPSGKNLVEAIAAKTPGKNFGIADLVSSAPEQIQQSLNVPDAYDTGVTPRSVGRQILDEKLIGPLGIGSNEANYSRAVSNLATKSKPTNAMLESISEYPVFQDSIFRRMKEILGYDQLNPTVPDQASIKNKIDKLNDTSFGDIETPMVAERAKRDLQRGVDFADAEKTVKETINAAQSTARKEAVENAVKNALGPEQLEEFKLLKAKSGSAGVAKDILEETLKKGQRSPNPLSSVTGTIGDLLGKKLPGLTAAGLDTASKIAKTAAPGVGAFIGGVGGALAEEAFDPASIDDTTEQSALLRQRDEEVRRRNNLNQNPEQAVALQKMYQNIDQGGTRVAAGDLIDPKANSRVQYLQSALQNVDPAFRQGYAYKQAEKELEQLTDPKKQLAEGNKQFKQSSPEELMQLSEQFKNIKGADRFVAPLENAAQAETEEERQARLFGLYQQPAFRQLLKKGSGNIK